MSVYPGDTINLLLSITRPDGATPKVSSPPVITIISVEGGFAVVTANPMVFLNGTEAIYRFQWGTSGLPNGDYMALVSYAADDLTVTNRLLKAIRLGDSRITGVVAQDSTVAKDATVAKDVSVAKSTDIAAAIPDNSAMVRAIKTQTDLIPAQPANQGTLTLLQQILTDLTDAVSGSWIIDKTVNPKTLTVRRISDNSVLFSYNLTDDSNQSSRLKN